MTDARLADLESLAREVGDDPGQRFLARKLLEVLAEVRHLRAELAARDDRWQRAVGHSLETAERLAAG